MSDSRLEKFIYAICSMDVSDLPVPLSRIEKLWNCLITGETPDFEPLSRNEKYLMAMLDRYDISNLPAPMSRGEKLLYKIAVGETDLSDVPGYLSRYEELLKYLIENGKNSEDDFEYVLYTLNQSLYTLYVTAEKPVKSAILKGNTLVNLLNKLTINAEAEQTKNWYPTTYATGMVKSGKYILLYNVKETSETSRNTPRIRLADDTYLYHGYDDFNTTTGIKKWIFTANADLLEFSYWITYNTGKVVVEDFILLEYQDGMENWDIPYFESIQSVKMPVLTTTGKNLFDLKEALDRTDTNYIVIDDSYDFKVSEKHFRTKIFEPTTTGQLTLSYEALCKDVTNFRMGIVYKDGTHEHPSYVSSTTQYEKRIITSNINKEVDYIRMDYTTEGNVLLRHVQIEEGSVATEYEPYKSNILSTPEDVELRGIGDVRDTLDCLTGELTQRIGEVVLDGSEEWTPYPGYVGEGNSSFVATITSLNNKHNDNINNIINDKFITGSWFDYANNQNLEIVWSNNPNQIGIRVKSEKASDVDGIKAFLSANNIKINYELGTESIKTVDLTVVDQDNQPTELGTFENVTHVSLEAENLIPEVEMEVATNLLEDTVFSLTDAFNTLYPTAEKPVVDGTLYGQTLSVSNYTFLTGKYLDINNGTIINGGITHRYVEDYFVIPEGTQVITLKGVNNYKKICYYDGNKRFIIGYNLSTQNTDDFTTDVPTGASYFRFNTSLTEITGGSPIVVDEYLHVYVDDYLYLTNKDGAKLISCKMPGLTTTGKNLFDGEIEEGVFDSNGNPSNYVGRTRSKNFIKVPKNTDLYISIGGANEASWTTIYFYNDKKEHTEIINTIAVNKTFNTGNNSYIKWKNNSPMSQITNIQIEKGSVATSYEPYKSTTLSTPSDLELRKVGDVRDELNVMTGELTERIGEVVLDGSESWVNHGEKTNTKVYRLAYSKLVHVNDRILCDKLPTAAPGDVEKIAASGNAGSEDCYAFYVALSKTKANTLSDFKSYLSENPLTVQYELKTPTTKTVDLSVVNQDGNVTTLKTFDDTTHVLLNSEGLIPTAVLTVRTKIPSGSSTSLLMDDISTEQQQLETTVDEQSENVDATMVATTEIFEETL